jgi:hypothetical protein
VHLVTAKCITFLHKVGKRTVINAEGNGVEESALEKLLERTSVEVVLSSVEGFLLFLLLLGFLGTGRKQNFRTEKKQRDPG